MLRSLEGVEGCLECTVTGYGALEFELRGFVMLTLIVGLDFVAWISASRGLPSTTETLRLQVVEARWRASQN